MNLRRAVAAHAALSADQLGCYESLTVRTKRVVSRELASLRNGCRSYSYFILRNNECMQLRRGPVHVIAAASCAKVTRGSDQLRFHVIQGCWRFGRDTLCSTQTPMPSFGTADRAPELI